MNAAKKKARKKEKRRGRKKRREKNGACREGRKMKATESERGEEVGKRKMREIEWERGLRDGMCGKEQTLRGGDERGRNTRGDEKQKKREGERGRQKERGEYEGSSSHGIKVKGWKWSTFSRCKRLHDLCAPRCGRLSNYFDL